MSAAVTTSTGLLKSRSVPERYMPSAKNTVAAASAKPHTSPVNTDSPVSDEGRSSGSGARRCAIKPNMTIIAAAAADTIYSTVGRTISTEKKQNSSSPVEAVMYGSKYLSISTASSEPAARANSSAITDSGV